MPEGYFGGGGVHDAAMGAEQLRVTAHEGQASRVTFSPDGKLLAAAGYDKTAKIFDQATGEEKLVYRGIDRPVTGIAFRPGGTRLSSCSTDKTITISDTVPLRQREQAVLLRPDARRTASKVLSEAANLDDGAQRLRSDQTLADDLREAALDELLKLSVQDRAPSAAPADQSRSIHSDADSPGR